MSHRVLRYLGILSLSRTNRGAVLPTKLMQISEYLYSSGGTETCRRGWSILSAHKCCPLLPPHIEEAGKKPLNQPAACQQAHKGVWRNCWKVQKSSGGHKRFMQSTCKREGPPREAASQQGSDQPKTAPDWAFTVQSPMMEDGGRSLDYPSQIILLPGKHGIGHA